MNNFPFMSQTYYPTKLIQIYQKNIGNIVTQALNKGQKETGDGVGSLLSAVAMEKMKKFGLIGMSSPDILYPTGFPTIDYLNGYIADQFDKSTGQMTKYFNLGITDEVASIPPTYTVVVESP